MEVGVLLQFILQISTDECPCGDRRIQLRIYCIKCYMPNRGRIQRDYGTSIVSGRHDGLIQGSTPCVALTRSVVGLNDISTTPH